MNWIIPKVNSFKTIGRYHILSLLMCLTCLHVNATVEEPCVMASDIKSTRFLVCSNQRNYSFIDLNGYNLAELNKPSVLTGYSFDGHKKFEAQGVNSGSTDLSFSGTSTLTFKGTKLVGSPPDLGYVTIDGNSGVCLPAKTGAYGSCYQKVKGQMKYDDDIGIPTHWYLNNPALGFSMGGYQGELNYDTAVRYCSVGSARLPTSRELAQVLEEFLGKQLIKETSFPEIEVNTPSVRREIGQMRAQGYQAIYKGDLKQTIDFYFLKVTDAKAESWLLTASLFVESNGEGDFGHIFFSKGAFFKQIQTYSNRFEGDNYEGSFCVADIKEKP